MYILATVGAIETDKLQDTPIWQAQRRKEKGQGMKIRRMETLDFWSIDESWEGLKKCY